MNFCSECGKPVTWRVPAGDHLPRHVCDQCDQIHYENPKMVVGTIPEWQGQVLLCRRAIEPRRGFWTLPAGFMENGETTAEGAARETWEEARARVGNLELFSLINVAHINQVHFFYRARLLEPSFGAGPESLEVRLFHEREIPWDDLAFQTVRETLLLYFDDRAAGRRPGLHTLDLPRRPVETLG